jgi:hypothetical protein
MYSSPLALSPPHTIRPFRGPETTIQTMREMAQGNRGERSVLVRSVTESVVRQLQPKDYLSEILAVRHFAATRCRYLNDPLTTEFVKDPQRMIEEILAHGKTTVDCDEIALLIATMLRQLGREADYVTVGFGIPGRFSHVFARGLEPRSNTWIICDPVAGTGESGMAHRVRTHKIWKID